MASRFSTLPLRLLAFVPKKRGFGAQPFPRVLSVWEDQSPHSKPRGGFLPGAQAAQGQTGTLLPPSGMARSLPAPIPVPTLLSSLRRGSLSLVGISEACVSRKTSNHRFLIAQNSGEMRVGTCAPSRCRLAPGPESTGWDPTETLLMGTQVCRHTRFALSCGVVPPCLSHVL